MAADPATCGVAMEVPGNSEVTGRRVRDVRIQINNAALRGGSGDVNSGRGGVQGFVEPSPRRGPCSEKLASTSALSTAPTVSATSALPGLLSHVESELRFPEATTKSA